MVWILLSLVWADAPLDPNTCNGLDDDLDGLIDDGVTCTGCTQFNDAQGSSYLICDGSNADRAAAAADCSARGYHLVDVDDTAEMALLEPYLNEEIVYWNSANDLVDEGIFVDSTGSEAYDGSWAAGQPDDGTLENCVLMYFPESTDLPHEWHDAQCDTMGASHVCESECVLVTWYSDQDGDGYGDVAQTTCGEVPIGAVLSGGDCDDADPSTHPMANEVCDNVDNDCDGQVDDDDPDVMGFQFYMDLDGDGVGGDLLEVSCISTGVPFPGDCDDTDPNTFPGAPDLPGDGVDQDCDGADAMPEPDTDTDTDSDSDVDSDADTDSDTDSDTDADADTDTDTDSDADVDPACDLTDSTTDCDGDGQSPLGGDCDDTDPTVHLGAEEQDDPIDHDCDGNSAAPVVVGVGCTGCASTPRTHNVPWFLHAVARRNR